MKSLTISLMPSTRIGRKYNVGPELSGLKGLDFKLSNTELEHRRNCQLQTVQCLFTCLSEKMKHVIGGTITLIRIRMS
jgi:hypothetical protein